jgi:hypothetical protein
MAEVYNKTSRDGIFLLGVGKTRTKSGNDPWIIRFDGQSSYFRGHTDVLNGFKNPNYREQMRRVENATTPCTGTSTHWAIDSFPTGHYRAWGPKNASSEAAKSYFEDDFTGFEFDSDMMSAIYDEVVLDGNLHTSAYNRAVAKLYTKLGDLYQPSKVGEDIGEIRQTLQMMRGPLKPLRELLTKGLNDVIKGTRKTNVRHIASALAGTALEWNLGWNTLTRQMAKTIVSLQNRDIMFHYYPFHATDFAVEGRSSGGLYTVNHNSSSLRAQWSVNHYCKKTVTFKGVMGEECVLPKRELSQALGLQTQNVIPTLWNLIPWSFVSDYFLNIGAIVSALEVPWGSVKWCNRTYLTEFISDVLIQMKPVVTSPGPSNERVITSFSAVPGRLSYRKSTFVRDIQDTQPLPVLELTSPLGLTGKKYVNLASLATQALLGMTKVLSKSVNRHPSLPTLYLEELGRRGGRDPYPFHRS